jgi:hypothetical protein
MMLIDLVNISGNLESIKRNTIMKSLITIEPKEITRFGNGDDSVSE